MRTRGWVGILALLFAGDAQAGFTQVLAVTGHYEPSIDAAGSSVTPNLSWDITRPTPDATVAAVYATVTSVFARPDPGTNCLIVAGIPVATPEVEVEPFGPVRTRYGEVSFELKGWLETLPVGTTAVPVVECGAATDNDGNALIVLWEDPTLPVATFALAFGAALTGNQPQLVLTTDPLDVVAPGFHLDVGLGISFSAAQPMRSEVVFEGAQLTTDAGGFDDGNLANGGLYTLGGDGDGTAQERFDVTAIPAQGEVSLEFGLAGNTFDDFAVVLWMWGVGVTTADYCTVDDGDEDGDGVGDPCDQCPGFDDALDSDLDLMPDGCDHCPNGSDFLDTDLDSVPDGCDLCAQGDDRVDADLDTFPDACEPLLRFLSPKRGPIDGGEPTVLIGSHFDASCVAWFDGVAAPTSFIDRSGVSAIPAAHDAGAVDVEVVCASGPATRLGAYTFFDPTAQTGTAPELLRVLPNQVGTAGTDTATIEGVGFSVGATVRVDGVDVVASLVDDTLITMIAPRHAAGLATVEVMNANGHADELVGALLYSDPPPSLAPAPTEEPAEPQVGSGRAPATGCNTAGPPLSAAPLLLFLALYRRRALAVAVLAAACTEYDVVPDPVAPGVAAQPPGVPPIALAAPPVRVFRGDPAGLDGTTSYDPDVPDAVLRWHWEVATAPDGADPVLQQANRATPTLTGDVVGSYVVSLAVTDEDGLVSSNPSGQAVEVIPWRDLEVRLDWTADVDLDVHLLAPGGTYYGPDDCFFANPSPDWGLEGVGDDDPSLDVDDDAATDGQHSETIALAAPPEGTLSVIVVLWNARDWFGPATGLLTVSGAGAELATVPISLAATGDALQVGSLDWTTLGWTDDGALTTNEELGGPPANQ
jgi:uncharacterized protein YfaP (DUF2135 family)